MFLKKICLLVLIATSITPSIEAHSTIDDYRLWKKLSTLKTKVLPHTTIKKTSIPNLGKENIKILVGIIIGEQNEKNLINVWQSDELINSKRIDNLSNKDLEKVLNILNKI